MKYCVNITMTKLTGDSQIDLHGLNHKEALEIAEDFILKESQNFGFTCKVITGNSIKLQEKIIKNIVNKYNFNYIIPNYNLGVIIIT